MATRRAVCNYHLLDLLTNWSQTTRTNSLHYINTTEAVARTFRTFIPSQRKATGLSYNSKTLRQIQEIAENDTGYKILNFRTIRRVCELGIYRKKYRLKARKPSIPQQGSNTYNLIYINPQQAICPPPPTKLVKIAT